MDSSDSLNVSDISNTSGDSRTEISEHSKILEETGSPLKEKIPDLVGSIFGLLKRIVYGESSILDATVEQGWGPEDLDQDPDLSRIDVSF